MVKAGITKDKIFFSCVFTLIGLGVLLRLYHITSNTFILYDEGMWLNHKRAFLALAGNNLPNNFHELLKFSAVWSKFSLATGKALWSFIAGWRIFFGGVENYFFLRIVSALSGVLTLLGVYFFSNQWHKSKKTAWLSCAVLAVLPSHVYYSRLALQESLSTCFFIFGLYFYFAEKRLSWKVFLSAFLLSTVFFANYRMIIIPVIIGFCEIYQKILCKEPLALRKYLWHTVTFLGIIFCVGGLFGGVNTYVTFAWMFHQSHLAKGHFSLVNLLSYPYYLFKLESVFFAILFFAGIYFAVRRQWQPLLPFFIVIFLMVIFSFPQEKGVRYLCSAFPLMAVSVGYFSQQVAAAAKNKKIVFSLWVFIALMFANHVYLSVKIAGFSTDYETSVADLKKYAGSPGILSSQDQVQKLFVHNDVQVQELPTSLQGLIKFYGMGFRYLIVDPQAYISFTKNKERFSPPLIDYLNIIINHVKPVKVYSHFNQMLFERFVLEHNENLIQSIRFINENKKYKYSELKVYDVRYCLLVLRKIWEARGAI